MKKKKVKLEVIRKSTSDKKCYICKGRGIRKDENNKPCETCDGTGVFKDNFYYMIANGICFGVDTIK